jgi:DNA-binding XRE family transcriptional regulator
MSQDKDQDNPETTELLVPSKDESQELTKPDRLTRKQLIILDCLMDSSLNTVTAVAKAAGVDRSTIYAMEKNPAFQRALRKRQRSLGKLGNRVIETLKISEADLHARTIRGELDNRELIQSTKYLGDIAKITKDYGFDEETEADISDDDLYQSIQDLIVMGVDPKHAEYYVHKGKLHPDLLPQETAESNNP